MSLWKNAALQELNGETFSGRSANRDSGARVDIAVDGFWGPGRERTFFNIRVFNPFAPTNRQISFPPVIGCMREKGRDSITREFVKWNMVSFHH